MDLFGLAREDPTTVEVQPVNIHNLLSTPGLHLAAFYLVELFTSVNLISSFNPQEQ
jgi:hypothetical protein